MNLFETQADLCESGFLFRIQDNGGTSYDRITVVFCDGDALLCAQHSTCAWVENEDVQRLANDADNSTSIDLAWGDLEPDLREQILSRVNDGWRDFLEAIFNREPHACAKTREAAEDNEGTYNSAGIGIYSVGEGYCVRVEGDDAANDHGPHMDARDALIATLPTDYSLSGPEYHPPLNVSSLEPTPGVAEALAALEKRIERAA